MWEIVGIVVVVKIPSPKFHAYVAMVPTGDEESEPLKKTVKPLTAVVKEAVGA